jgi:hypothetical protein
MGLFGALKSAVKAPVKAVQKLPGMGSVNKAVGKVPGMGAMGGALGLGPSPQMQQQNGLMGKAGAIGQMASQMNPGMNMQKPQPMQSVPPMGDANQLSLGARNPQDTPEQNMIGQMQAPDSMGSMPQPMNPSQDNPAAMMANRQMQMQQGQPMGIGPSFGAASQQNPRMMGRGQMRNPRMM